MSIQCWCWTKSCCAFVLVCLNLLWMLKLTLRDTHPDYRVEAVGLLHSQPFESVEGEMYLRKIETTLKMENFELIEMMNETIPNDISEDAILVVSASHSAVDNTYAHFLEKVQKSNGDTHRLPFYLLRKAKSILLQNYNEIKSQADEIAHVLDFFTTSLPVKKLTILSFEEGSLLTLKSLALVSHSTFSLFHKLILINPLNPSLMICHSTAASFLQDIKASIVKDPARMRLVNQTRIIIINTVNSRMGTGDVNWLLRNSEGQLVSFANTIMISSRFMWNVYCFLKPSEYFKFQPFLWLLTKLFNQDRSHGPLSPHALSNLLLFRQLPLTRELSVLSRRKLLPKCVDFQLENYSYDGDTSNAECIKLVRKENYFFNANTTIIIRSPGRFEVYGESYEKLSPFDTKTKETIYVLENILDYRRFFIVNRRRYPVHFALHSISRPPAIAWQNDSLELPHLDFSVVAVDQPKPILICPGLTLIYPNNFMPIYRPLGFELESEDDCYLGNDYFLEWVHQLIQMWSLGLNVSIFTLFCSHVLKKSTFSRFYSQLFVNFILTLLHTGESLLAENLLILAAVVVFELVLKFIALLAQMISMPKSFAAKIMWTPLVFELLRNYDSNLLISPWKVIGVQFLAATHQNNIIILFLEFGFIVEYIVRDISSFQGLFLVCIWLTITAVEPDEKKSPQIHSNLVIISTGQKIKSLKSTVLRLRRQLVDSITVCIMAACVREDGLVMHYIVDFYIVTYALFAAHQWLDEYL